MSLPVNQDREAKNQAVTRFDRIFRDKEGQIVIVQPPNLTVLVGFSATLLQWLLPVGKLQIGLDLVAFGVLFTWAWQELFEGVNYFRRAIGLIGLVGLIAWRLSEVPFVLGF